MLKKIIDMMYNITAGCAVVSLLEGLPQARAIALACFIVTLVTHYLYILRNKKRGK